MSDKPEQSDAKSPEEIAAGIEELPKAEEMRQYDADTQKAILAKFGGVESDDDEDQDSDPSDDNSDDDDSDKEKKEPKEDDQTDDEDEEEDESSKNTDSDKTDESDEEESGDDSDKQKKKETDDDRSRKELQAEFTRRSQRLKQEERENQELRERVAKLEGMLEGKLDQKSEKPDTSPLHKMAESNPKLKPLVDAIDAALDMKVDSVSKKVDDKFKKTDEEKQRELGDKNFASFSDQVNDFLDSDLGKRLEEEFNVIAEEKYGKGKEGEAALEDAARRDPELFETLKGKLFTKHFKKVSELMAKESDDDEEKDVKEREKQAKKTGVSGKSKTAGPKAADDLAAQIKRLKKQQGGSKKIKELLAQHGAVEKE